MKELKVAEYEVWRATIFIVESGEGIESLPPHPAGKGGQGWNPVKELKVEPTAPIPSLLAVWNPVKELKVTSEEFSLARRINCGIR